MTPTFNEILREAVFGTLSDRRGLLSYGVPTSALLAVALTIGMLGDVIFGTIFVGVMIAIALVIISFYWQRRYLLGPEFDPVRMRLLGSYLWRAAVLFVALYVLAFILSSPFFPGDYWSENYYNDVVVFDGTMLTMTLISYPLIILSGRLLLVFPAVAVDRPISWRESWKLAGNRGFHLGIVVILLDTPWLVFEALALSTFQDNTAGIVVYIVVSSFLAGLAMLMALVASAFLYKSTARTTAST